MSTDAIQASLRSLLKQVDGSLAAVVSTSDGMELTRVLAAAPSRGAPLASQVGTVLASAFSFSAEQAAKTDMGPLSCQATFFDKHVVVQVDAAPLVISIIGTASTNVGLVIRAASELREAVEPLRSATEKCLFDE